VLETEAWERLCHFRNELYGSLGLRQDSLFELIDGCGADRIASQHVGAAQPERRVPSSLAEHV
jgi:hypothetical protein